MSYFPSVTCVSSHDRILLFRQCFLGFLVHYYSAIPFHIGAGAEIQKKIRKTSFAVQKNQKNFNCGSEKSEKLHLRFRKIHLRFRKIRKTSIAVQVCSFNIAGYRGFTDDFAIMLFHLYLSFAAIREYPKHCLVHSLILSPKLFYCIPLLLAPFTFPTELCSELIYCIPLLLVPFMSLQSCVPSSSTVCLSFLLLSHPFRIVFRALLLYTSPSCSFYVPSDLCSELSHCIPLLLAPFTSL